MLTLPNLTSKLLSGVRMLEDGEHVIKQGKWDLILAEYNAYTLLQHIAQFPIVCERFVDCGPRSKGAEIILHKVIVFEDLLENHGELSTHILRVPQRC